LILKANNYFTASLAWSGDGVESATDNAPATFRAGKDSAIRYATATITLSPKVGYTFQGTTLVYADFVNVGGTNPFGYGAPTGGTLTAGTEGDLILTIPYPVVEKVILYTDFNKENFKKLIGRPIHGNDVVLSGEISGTDYVEDFSPYTAIVEWPADTGPLLYGKFNVADLTASSPIATVTLIPKEGYKFGTGGYYLTYASNISQAIAVDGPVAAAGSVGNIDNVVDPYILKFILNYSNMSSQKILKQITTLEGIGVNEIAEFLVSEKGGYPLSVTPLSSEIMAVTAVVYEGLIGATDYPVDDIVRVRIGIAPADGYTFKSMTGTTSYFTESDANRDKVIEYLKKVYKGSPVVVGTDLVPLVDINSVTGITLLGNGGILIEATYKTKPRFIEDTEFGVAYIGDFIADAIDAGETLPGRLESTGLPSPHFTTSDASDGIVWTAKTAAGVDVPLDDSSVFVAANIYTAAITVTPRPGYTFVDSDFGAIETQLSGTVWAGGEIDNANGLVKVTGFTVFPNDTSEAILAKDKITVTITFTIP
jgi:hypothetical protein